MTSSTKTLGIMIACSICKSQARRLHQEVVEAVQLLCWTFPLPPSWRSTFSSRASRATTPCFGWLCHAETSCSSFSSWRRSSLCRPHSFCFFFLQLLLRLALLPLLQLVEVGPRLRQAPSTQVPQVLKLEVVVMQVLFIINRKSYAPGGVDQTNRPTLLQPASRCRLLLAISRTARQVSYFLESLYGIIRSGSPYW